MPDTPLSDEDLNALRENIARANGFGMYKKYGETEAAGFLGIHPQTLKRVRLDGKIEHLNIGARSVGYFGYQIADYLIGSIAWRKPESPSSSSETAGLARKPAAKLGTGTGTILDNEKHAAFRLAQQALKKPKKD